MTTENIDEKTGAMLYGFLKSFLKEKKQSVKNFLTKYQIGFVPEDMDYSAYSKLKNNTILKQLKFLIGKKHPTLKITLMGLYMSSLKPAERKIIYQENKGKVLKKYGSQGVTILYLAMTGFLRGYVKWLADINLKRDLSQEELTELYYEGVLRDWEERSIFIHELMKEKTLASIIQTKINIGKTIFFAFASYSAIKVADKVIHFLEKSSYFKNNGYEFTEDILHNNIKEKFWVFEKI